MKIISTKFSGLKIILSKNHRDSRGLFKEDFKMKFFKNKKFIFGCTSSSKKNVIRGMHLQTKFSQEKYISILKGAIFDVAIDLRKNSGGRVRISSIKTRKKPIRNIVNVIIYNPNIAIEILILNGIFFIKTNPNVVSFAFSY